MEQSSTHSCGISTSQTQISKQELYFIIFFSTMTNGAGYSKMPFTLEAVSKPISDN